MYEEEMMDVSCILDAEHGGEPELLVCPKCGGDFIVLAKKARPKGDKFKVGTMLSVQNPDGKSFPVFISEVRDKAVLIDFNHPLAKQGPRRERP